MINIKKRLTVDLNKVISRSIKEHPNLISVIDNPKYLAYFVDADKTSDFYFGILKETLEKDGQLYIEFGCKPLDNLQNVAGTKRRKIPEFENYFKEWLNNLEVYNEKGPLDDLILNGYQEEFYNDFKIVDEDADEKAFSFGQQLRINNYLQTIVVEIESQKSEENADVIELIKEEAISLQADMTKETKNNTMKRLSKIWAKARKSSLKLGEFMIKEFTKELLKEGAKSLFNFASTNSHKLPQYIEYFMNSGTNNL